MIVQSIVDIENLSEILAEKGDIQDLPGSKDIPITAEPVIEFKNVSFHYPSQPAENGLKKVSLTIPAGTTTAIVGHTGAGKTTISRLLFRFYDALDGVITIGGHDIKKATQKSLRGLIGIVPQDTVLFNDTIRYNIRYGRQNATDEEVEKAAQEAQILDFIMSLPDKWDTTVGERGLKLSGGEKQRVSIARCLLKNPPIVVLDEATSALDTITEYSVQTALNALGKNRTIIIVAHRLSTIRHADQILVMDTGNVIEAGSHDELLAKDSEYKKLWDMQINSRVEFTNKAVEVADVTPQV
jgi:ABC-type multidrug transport system fused ATPase/permease subunit